MVLQFTVVNSQLYSLNNDDHFGYLVIIKFIIGEA